MHLCVAVYKVSAQQVAAVWSKVRRHQYNAQGRIQWKVLHHSLAKIAISTSTNPWPARASSSSWSILFRVSYDQVVHQLDDFWFWSNLIARRIHGEIVGPSAGRRRRSPVRTKLISFFLDRVDSYANPCSSSFDRFTVERPLLASDSLIRRGAIREIQATKT
jgi:hypothetical protein